MPYLRYSPALISRALRMLELGAATVNEVAALTRAPVRTVENWARLAELDHTAIRARGVQAIWERDTMPRAKSKRLRVGKLRRTRSEETQ